jgi:hypothetical protein
VITARFPISPVSHLLLFPSFTAFILSLCHSFGTTSNIRYPSI